MNIQSIMVPAKINAAPDYSFKQLLNDMLKNNHSCGLIGINKQLQGMISAKDILNICQKSMDNMLVMEELTVAEVMHLTPFCLHQNTPIYDALVTAKVNHLKNLPVIDDNENLVGIVSQTELLDTYIDLMETDQVLRVANKKLQSLALEDALMKIGSRHAMEIDLKYKEAEAKRHKTFYSIVMFDVDFFKSYNDEYGHQCGDKALTLVAKIIEESKRSADRVYRYGGEEILVIMSDTNLGEAMISADRMRAAIQDAKVEHKVSPLGILTVSAGICSKQAGDWMAMIKIADKALYQAKHSGRNCVKSGS